MSLRVAGQFSSTTIIPLLFFAHVGIAHGADIYRWVDDNGRVQFSDSPPPPAKKAVTRIDSRQFEPSPEARREAEARAARDKARAKEESERRAEEAVKAAVPVPDPKAAKRPDVAPVAAKDCSSMLQRFRESSECYAPYMNANGSRKPGAIEACGPAVPYPAQECS